jgi:signal transduction histidine kinase
MTSPAPALPVSSDLGPAAPLPGDAAASLAPSAGLEAATEPGFGSLGGLAVPREPITPEELVRDTAQRFFTDPELDALAVVSGGRPVGLVTRPRLLLMLARNFGHEVFARKPIARLADAGALVLPAEMPAVEAVSRALARPVAAVYDDVVVVEESGDYRGLLSVRRLVVEQGLALALSIVDREAALARAAELERMDAMRAQLIAHVTHELRSPVNAIAGLAELLRMACEKQSWDKVPERVELIRTSAASLRTIVKNGLDLMKMKAGKMEVAAQRVDLAPLVREVAETARVLLGPKPVRVAVRAPAAGPSVETDAQKVRQILVNLASNAAKFTDAGLVTITLEEEGRGARLAVSDTGIGIRDEDLPNLFVPFGQLEDAGTKRREGTGLGLVITRKLTELLGGSIELHSRYGQGSTFVVHLPPAPPPGGTP